MTSKVLIADDSLTIQKVINITLASSGYELVECLNEDDLIKKVGSNQYDLVLLDFNLSDSKSGYELSNLIKSKLPNTAIIVMLGTFDTVDESQFSSCGITDKIVKPFESSKFIKKCKDALDGMGLVDNHSSDLAQSFSSKEQDEDFSSELNLDSWTMEAPHSEIQVTAEDDFLEDDFDLNQNAKDLDPLASEMQGWGFNSSNSIEEAFDKSFPPVIEETNSNVLERLANSSNFEINDDDLMIDNNETDPAINVSNIMTQSIESEIEDELAADDFWAVDEVVAFEAVEKDSINDNNIEEVTADLTESINQFRQQKTADIQFTNQDFNQAAPAQFDEAAIVEKLKQSLKPMIEEMVKEFCSKQAERVAWEIIPDLAENLIREEIRSLSDSVKH